MAERQTREEFLLYQRHYNQKHEVEHRARSKKSYHNNKEKVIARSQERYRRVKERVFSHYSWGVPECHRCGETDIDVLCVDHINNNGTEHARTIGGKGVILYLWLERNNYPAGFQILCANCNLKKEILRRRKRNWRSSQIMPRTKS